MAIAIEDGRNKKQASTAMQTLKARPPKLIRQANPNVVDALKRDAEGKIIKSIENILYYLQYSPTYCGTIKYNELADRLECFAHPGRLTQEFDDLDLSLIKLHLETYGFTNAVKIMDAVRIAGHEDKYHPVRNIMDLMEWDEKEDYLSELFPKFLGAERSDYTTQATKILFGGLVSRVYQPGCKFDTAVILVDRQQGGGKSSLCRLLALKDKWYCSLRDINDVQKYVEVMTGHLVVELEEMEVLKTAKTIEAVRSFLSKQQDTYRKPYDKFPHDVLRGSICIGTTNDINVLPQDRAGNRRFLPIMCDKTKAEQHPLDDEQETRHFIEKCYGQAMYLYRRGELPTYLSNEWEKELTKQQEQFTPEDTKAGVIEQWITDSEEGKKQEYICVPMIYQKALCNIGLPKQLESKEIASILDGLVDDDGQKLLKRYDKSGGIRRFNQPGFAYGRQKTWVRASEQPSEQASEQNRASEQASEQFLEISDEDTPFDD